MIFPVEILEINDFLHPELVPLNKKTKKPNTTHATILGLRSIGEGVILQLRGGVLSKRLKSSPANIVVDN